MEKMGAGEQSEPKVVKQLQEKPEDFMIVGLGASAGGIQALQEFFRNVPENSGMAYVVILHLSPDHDSKLAQVLQLETAMPVTQVKEKTIIKPDHVYVVPPDRHLTMEGEYIAVTPNVNIEDRRAPVDIFFRTLADQHGPRAISVTLSGTGANGSMGLKRIKERGGATYVQNPREAEFNEMPRNSIATEFVDEVLNVADIPTRIIAYRNGIGAVEIIEENEKRPEPQQQALREIFNQLRIRTGHDFSNYKRPTLLRRIERRINVHRLSDLPAYTAYIQEHPEETQALLKDLLISVTNFFRDGKAFNYLEQHVIKQIFAGKTSADQVRIWVAGCATGEEAYSLAMFCAEQVLGTLDPPKVQIFATDIDESAIATAREGLYTLNDAADVSPDRLRRFFTRDGDSYRVRREIREMILFANHNFLKDPPFSKLDLVSCRNVLIYLNSTAQERVIETFHFALKPKSFLFLGTSESVDAASDLFAISSREHHIFQTRELASRNYPVPEAVPKLLPFKTELLQKIDGNENRGQRISFGELHQRLLEQYAPPSVVVNQEYEIVHMTEKAGKYMEFAGGEPTQNLLKLVRPQLRLELRSALYQAVQNKSAVEARNIKFSIDGQLHPLDIHVRPVLAEGDTARGFILVIFKPAEDPAALGETVMVASDEPIARKLEEELIGLKTQLRNSVEQHEYQAEELKASNEELQAMNEELRAAAEELETSKEELQSINEELRTVNQELKVKIEETTLTSNNLQNLINSANVGTIFLDRSFAIRLFTPAILDIFNLKIGDYGRPITDITNKLNYEHLLQDAETVLTKLTVVEQEVTTSDHRVFMMRVLPYRTSEDRINGVVITFFDITRRKESEEALLRSEEKYRIQLQQEVEARTAELKENQELLQATLDSSVNMIQVFKAVRDGAGKIIDFIWLVNNETAERLHGDLTGESLLQQHPGVLETGIFNHFAEVTESGIPQQYEIHYVHEQFNGWFHQSVVKLNDGVATSTLDITDRKRAEESVKRSEENIRMFVTASSDLIFQMSADWSKMHAIQRENFLAKTEVPTTDWMSRYIPADEQEKVQAAVSQAISKKQVFELEHRLIRANGDIGWSSSRAVPMFDEHGEIMEWFGVATDITGRKVYEAERDKNYLLLRQSELLEDTGTWDYDLLTGTFSCSEGMYRLFNQEKGKEITPDVYLQYATKDCYDKANKIKKHIERGDVDFEDTIKINIGETVKVLTTKASVIKNEEGLPVRVLGVHMDVTATRQAEGKLRQMAAEQQLEIFLVTLRTQEEERRRISESLHNGLGQILFGTRISMNHLSLDKANEDPDQYNKSKQYTEKLLTKAIWESRNISHELMPATLEKFGLQSAIDDVCLQLSGSVNFHCHYSGVESRIEKYMELAVFRTVQELMLNVVKHAAATEAQVVVSMSDENILIRVSDNGRGIQKVQETDPGIGLSSIHSKIKLLNGTVDINSVEGKGTEIIINIPVGNWSI